MNAADFPSVTFLGALKTLREMPLIVRQAVAGASPEELRERISPDSFCLLEHACHLRDLEREGYLVRLRRMLSENDPRLSAFEGEAIARTRNYLEQNALEAEREFALARTEFLLLAGALQDGDMRRTGQFMGRQITVCDLLAMMVEHDREHREEIGALVALRGAL
jgi:hypothetical protein